MNVSGLLLNSTPIFTGIMFIFIILNLCISFLIKVDSPIQTILITDGSLYLGVVLLIVNLLASWLFVKKISYKLRYDLFAVGSLLVWASYWPPFFRFGSPLFQYYPLYFALITAIFSLVFITKRHNVDPDALVWLQWLSDSGRFHPLIIMIAVMVSLALPQHFILYPALITILVLRFTLASCLNSE